MSRVTARRWVSRSQAARIAGVHPTTINEWKKSGAIPASATMSVGKRCVRYDSSFFRAPDQVVAHV